MDREAWHVAVHGVAKHWTPLRDWNWTGLNTISWSLLKCMPMSWWCHPTISSSVVPFSSCLQSFPSSGSIPLSWLFHQVYFLKFVKCSVFPNGIRRKTLYVQQLCPRGLSCEVPHGYVPCVVTACILHGQCECGLEVWTIVWVTQAWLWDQLSENLAWPPWASASLQKGCFSQLSHWDIVRIIEKNWRI